MWCETQQEIGVRGPAVAAHQARVARHANGFAQCRNAHQTHRGGEVRHALDLHERAHRPPAVFEQPLHRRRRIGHREAFTHHQVGAPLETASKLRHDHRRIGEVGLQQQDGVATGIARACGYVPQQRVDGARIAQSRRAAQHRDRHGALVLLGHIGRVVRARVVVHHDFVLARKLGQHCAEPPEQHANGGNFVVRGNGEVEHEEEMRETGEPVLRVRRSRDTGVLVCVR